MMFLGAWAPFFWAVEGRSRTPIRPLIYSFVQYWPVLAYHGSQSQGRKLYSRHYTSRLTIRLRKGLNEIKQGGSPHRRQTPQRRSRIRFSPKGKAFREVFRLRSRHPGPVQDEGR